MKTSTFAGLAAALALAACTSGSNTVGARFASPTAIASFAGNLRKAGGSAGTGQLRDYFAVASSRNDELVILDPSDEQPVLGPGAVFPLSIPTAPRPMLLAAATLGDRRDVAGADLVVVVSSGSLVLQLVNTWNPDAARVEPLFGPDGSGGSIDLSAQLGADAEILAIAAIPTPPGATSPRARLVAAASGGRLAVVDFVRGAPRQGEDPGSPPVVPDSSGDPAAKTAAAKVSVQQIGVDPLDLAVDPDGTRLFAATRDALGKDGAGADVFGVLQIDVQPDPAATWPTTALGAKSATLAVAATKVRERRLRTADPSAADPFDGFFDSRDQNGPDEFDQNDAVVRVYAALDQDGPNGCGQQRAISCGIATLVPSAAPAQPRVALAEDLASHLAPAVLAATTPGVSPVPVQSYRTPMTIGGVATAMTVALPVAQGTSRVLDDLNGSIPLVKVDHTFGPKNTSAVGGVASTDGRVYLLDLGRATTANDISFVLNGQPSVSPAASTSPNATSDLSSLLALSTDFPVDPSRRASTDPASGATGLTTVAAVLPRLIQVTPGFTGNHDYALTWQGTLPNLSSRRGTLVVGGGTAYAAVQLRASSGDLGAASSWVVGASVAAPELGVHAGDSVLVECASAAATEVHVASVLRSGDPGLPAGVAFPGGALQLDAVPACATAGAAPQDVTLTVRAQALVLTRSIAGQGAHLEYVGRPAPFDRAENPTPVVYALQWRDESDPALTPEELALARAARRTFYPADPGCTTAPVPGCFTGAPWIVDPLAPGPVVAFKVGLVDATQSPSTQRLARDAQITFTTSAGFSPASRRPVTAGVLPRAVTAFDRTKFAGHANDPIRFYATYLDDAILSFSPSDASGVVRTIR